MSSLRSRRLVRTTSWRELSGSSGAGIPAAASSGKVSSKMRPLESASVITGTSSDKSQILPQRMWKTLFFKMFVGRFPSTAGAILTSSHALDARAELRELLLDALVAAVEMIDPVYPSLALGDQTGYHEARRSAQVRRHHVRPSDPGDSGYYRGISRNLAFGAE